jgi:hypothetical protein
MKSEEESERASERVSRVSSSKRQHLMQTNPESDGGASDFFGAKKNQSRTKIFLKKAQKHEKKHTKKAKTRFFIQSPIMGMFRVAACLLLAAARLSFAHACICRRLSASKDKPGGSMRCCCCSAAVWLLLVAALSLLHSFIHVVFRF